MRILLLILLCLMLMSCSVQYSVLDTDDTYVMKHYNRGSYSWFRYSRPNYYSPNYVNPYYNPLWYPQREVIVIVPKQTQPQIQYGKRPDRGSLPNHNRNLTEPRRGRN